MIIKFKPFVSYVLLHKTNKHSDSNCRAQQNSVPPDAAKKWPTGAKKMSKSRRLRFKSSNEQKKIHAFHRIDGRVSFEDSSNEDDSEVVEQSLMHLHTVLKIPKVEDNPFSPDPFEMDTERYPSLLSPGDPILPQATVPLPTEPVLINGVYYHQVPPSHNVVLATSSVPDPTLVAVPPTEVLAPNGSTPSADKSKFGLEFVMPDQPPAKKTGRSSPTLIRSSSRTRSRPNSRSNSRSRRADNQCKSPLEPPNTRSGRGCGRKRPDIPTTPIQVPASHSHLMAVPKPKKGLKITFSTATHEQKVETMVHHLERLAKEASTPFIVTSKPSTDTAIQPEPVLA